MLRRTQSSRRRSEVLSTVVLLAVAMAFANCGREAPSGLNDLGQPLFKGKPPPAEITVTDYEPVEGEQGQTFPMTVRGSGFGKGAKVIFLLNGEDVTTISTTMTSVDEAGENLTADVEIGLDAVVSKDYQVAVSLRGSRGVGTEKFEVKLRPNELLYGPLEISLTDGAGYRVRSDQHPLGGYANGEDPSLNVNAYVSSGEMHSDPGRVDINRLSYTTGRYFRMGPGSERVWPRDDDFAADLLEVCGSNPCEATEKMILRGRDFATDASGNVLAEGILSLATGQIGTTRLGILWFDEDERGRTIGKTVLRYGHDCSNPVGGLADGVAANRVSVTAIDDDGDGMRDYWVVEGSKAHLCRWDGKIKGKYVDRGYGEFDAPIQMRITLIGDLVPDGPGGN